MSYKVLLAPFEIAGNSFRIASHLRKAGVDAISCSYQDNWLGYECDLNLHLSKHLDKGTEEFERYDKFVKEAIEKYDIFQFQFAQSLRPDFSDLAEIKKRGKKILFSFWGSDQRHPDWIKYTQFRFLGLDPPKPRFLDWERHYKHKVINRYADVIFGFECIPRGLFLYGMIDPDEWTLEEKAKIIEVNEAGIEKDPEYTYFLHSPSNKWSKGTEYFLECWKEVEKAGIKAKLMTLERMPPKEARKRYAHADYALEQIGVGTFGLFGLEMMCWEIPILVYQIPLFDKMYGNPPVIGITKENFVDQVKYCVESNNPERGEIARQWVLDHATIQKAIPTYIDIYERLMAGEQIPQLINRGWYDEEARIIEATQTEQVRKWALEQIEELKESGQEPSDELLAQAQAPDTRSLFYRWSIDRGLIPLGTKYDKQLYV